MQAQAAAADAGAGTNQQLMQAQAAAADAAAELGRAGAEQAQRAMSAMKGFGGRFGKKKDTPGKSFDASGFFDD